MPSPDPLPGQDFLLGWRPCLPRSAWAVGNDYDSVGFPGTLAEHWNGKTWQQVAAPDAPNAASPAH